MTRTGAALDFQLQYSLSDRIRYYWPDPAIAAAQDKLFANLRETRAARSRSSASISRLRSRPIAPADRRSILPTS